MTEQEFCQVVAQVLKGDHNDLRKEAIILRAHRQALATPSQRDPQSRGQAFDGEGEGFTIGDPVEKFTGEAIWHGVIVASYLTSKGKRRYVVEVKPQGFQMIAVPSQLRALSSAKRGEEG